MIGDGISNFIKLFLKIGDVSGGDYAEFQEDGSLQYHGNATVWDDIVGSLIGKKLFSNTGTIDYDYDENAIKMQDDGDITDRNDRIVFNFQKPHKMKADAEMRLHIHWEQINTDKIEFTTEYRVQKNNNAKTTEWTRIISNSDDNSVFTYPGSGTFNQITELAQIDLTDSGISATVEFRLTRSDSLTPVILATFVDVHYEIDSDGSRQEYVK